MRGFFGIGIQNSKTEMNIGTLWRSANIMGASFIFTIGKRYKKQSSDTLQSWRHIPLYHYLTFDEFYNAIPFDCRLIGVELSAKAIEIQKFSHPERCVYLLGAEDHGLTKESMEICNQIVKLPGDNSMNVAVAGSIVMFDRITKQITK